MQLPYKSHVPSKIPKYYRYLKLLKFNSKTVNIDDDICMYIDSMKRAIPPV
jgi:hypothetical protein